MENVFSNLYANAVIRNADLCGVIATYESLLRIAINHINGTDVYFSNEIRAKLLEEQLQKLQNETKEIIHRKNEKIISSDTLPS